MHLLDADDVGEPADLALAVAGDEHHPRESVRRLQVAHERGTVRPGRIAKPQQPGCAAVNHDHALEAARHRGQFFYAGRIHLRKFLAAGDGDGVHVGGAVEPLHAADQPVSRLLGELFDLEQPHRLLGGRLHDGRGQRMLRIAFEAGGHRQKIRPAPAVERDDIDELGRAVGERAGLVEDRGAAGVEPLENRRVADHDPTLRRQRHGADDRHRDRDQQRAGGGDDEHGEKPRGTAAEVPGGRGNRDGQRRIEGTEGIGEPAQLRPPLLARPQHVHDLGIAAVGSHPIGADLERGLAVD